MRGKIGRRGRRLRRAQHQRGALVVRPGRLEDPVRLVGAQRRQGGTGVRAARIAALAHAARQDRGATESVYGVPCRQHAIAGGNAMSQRDRKFLLAQGGDRHLNETGENGFSLQPRIASVTVYT